MITLLTNSKKKYKFSWIKTTILEFKLLKNNNPFHKKSKISQINSPSKDKMPQSFKHNLNLSLINTSNPFSVHKKIVNNSFLYDKLTFSIKFKQWKLPLTLTSLSYINFMSLNKYLLNKKSTKLPNKLTI